MREFLKRRVRRRDGAFLAARDLVAAHLREAGRVRDADDVAAGSTRTRQKMGVMAAAMGELLGVGPPRPRLHRGEKRVGWHGLELVPEGVVVGAWSAPAEDPPPDFADPDSQPDTAPHHAPPIDELEEALRREDERRDERATKSLNARLLAELATLRKRVEVLDELSAVPPPVGQRPTLDLTRRRATAVMLLSDLHVEEPITLAQTNGLNRYDLALAEAGLGDLTVGARWLLEMWRSLYVVEDLVVWLGGDLISGHIHEDLAETCELSPVQAIGWLYERTAAMLEELALDPLMLTLTVPCNIGNHGRTTKERRVATAIDHSFEWLLYYFLAQRFQGHEKIRIVVPQGILTYLEIGPQIHRFTHGDAVGFGGGVGGITIPINKAIAGWDRGTKADHTNMGHFHQRVGLPHLAVNGCLSGYGPYSVQIRAGYEDPQQTMYLVDDSRGKVSDTSVWVSRRVPR